VPEHKGSTRVPPLTDNQSLAIELTPVTGGLKLAVGIGDSHREWPRTIPFSVIDALDAVVRKRLEDVSKRFGPTLKGDPDRAAEGLKGLYDIGREIWGAILGEPHEFIDWIDEKLRFCPHPIRSEIVTPPDVRLPLAIMPVRLSGEAATLEYRHCLPAFRGPVRHVMLKSMSQDSSLFGSRALPFLLLQHSEAPYVSQARAVLDTLQTQGHASVTGPYPIYGGPQTEDEIADLLVAPPTVAFGEHVSMPTQVVHVHAHAVVARDAASGPTLQFAYKRRLRVYPLTIMYSHLNSASDRAHVRRKELSKAGAPLEDRSRGPLAFLSACGAADQHDGAFGLVRHFLAAGYRGVIGPWISIPGHVANEIAEYFYERLFSESRRPVGLALYEARDRLLAECFNPLGALFALYGNDELQVGTRN